MGIGASYIGAGGARRTFELDGVPAIGTPAADMLGMHTVGAPGFAQLMQMPAQTPTPMPQIPSLSDDADRGKVRMTEGDVPDVLSRKIAPFGSITAGAGGLCLKGEEGGSVGGTRMYGTKDGANGFFSMSEIDPGAGGTLLNGTGNTPDGGMATLEGKTGAVLRVGGRIDIQIEVDNDDTRYLTVKEFYRLADISPNGRIVRVSKEIERLLMKQPINGGGGNGKYGVKPVFDGNGLSALQFGSEQELEEGTPKHVVETATCPNAAQEDD